MNNKKTTKRIELRITEATKVNIKSIDVALLIKNILREKSFVIKNDFARLKRNHRSTKYIDDALYQKFNDYIKDKDEQYTVPYILAALVEDQISAVR